MCTRRVSMPWSACITPYCVVSCPDEGGEKGPGIRASPPTLGRAIGSFIHSTSTSVLFVVLPPPAGLALALHKSMQIQGSCMLNPGVTLKTRIKQTRARARILRCKAHFTVRGVFSFVLQATFTPQVPAVHENKRRVTLS